MCIFITKTLEYINMIECRSIFSNITSVTLLYVPILDCDWTNGDWCSITAALSATILFL